ncbi:IclR family transcriptional regulator C-terminal domain-containing protein [Streptomyces sp. NPDC052302]|uniref:IclR family transcriptional regulator domain-containing protein n=1 Tax=Streptomyces sp. NPDC052302 TaxID=3365688 RepID=UPI0037D62DC6
MPAKRIPYDGDDPSGAAAPGEAVNPLEAVAPLIRGVTVLLRLTEAGGTLSASALERATGLARSTVDRVAATLARMGYVRLDGRDVTLAPRVLELGNAYLAALGWPALLAPYADALAGEADESVTLAVPDRDGVRLVHQSTHSRALSLGFPLGELLPAGRTAPGAVFAAEWRETDWQTWHDRRSRHRDEDFEQRARRAGRDGWAVDDQLTGPGLLTLSVPVRDPREAGRIVCAASVVSHTGRHTAAGLCETHLPRLRNTATAMERALRDAPIPGPAAGPAGLASWTGASKQELGREFVASLARGLTVLTAFGEGRGDLTLTDVARTTGLTRATARRALLTYGHLGLVRRSGTRTFRLTPRVLSLGFPPLSRMPLSRIAAPHLAELSDRIGESVSLAVLTPSGEETRCTAATAPAHALSAGVEVGVRRPAHANPAGHVLLADLPPDLRKRALCHPSAPDPDHLTAILDAVARQGHALSDDEPEAGLRSLAVPVRDGEGEVTASIETTVHRARRTREECAREVLPHLRAAAAGLEADLREATRFTHVRLSL